METAISTSLQTPLNPRKRTPNHNPPFSFSSFPPFPLSGKGKGLKTPGGGEGGTLD